MERTITVTAGGGGPVSARAYILYEDWDFEAGMEEFLLAPGEDIVFDDDPIQTAGRIVVVPRQPGFWAAGVAEFDYVTHLDCPAIDAEGLSWWHRLLGREIENPDRGADIRIGVIDAGFAPDESLAHVTFLPSPERPAYRPTEFWAHGEAVCRILSDRTAPDSCAPIAPGAELIFADATFTPVTCEDEDFIFPLGGGDPTEYLDPRRVSNAIFQLVFDHEVDLINLSLGTFDEVEEDLESGVAEAIRAAIDAGVTVICAAGNTFREGAAFPARLEACVGVAAFGELDWAPDGTVARDLHQPHLGGVGDLDGLGVFHSPESAYGPGVDTLGPGVGILVARDGLPAYDLSGTSFAAPIVTGLLAIELSRDRDYLDLCRDEARDDYARARLRGLCTRTGMDPVFEGEGILALELESN